MPSRSRPSVVRCCRDTCRSLVAKNGRVCAFDRPGFGASAYIAHAFDGVTAADELHALLPAAGIARPFVYVGHSLGGNFAQIYAARYPHDVEALILIEPGYPRDLLGQIHDFARYEGTEPHLTPQAIDRAWDNYFIASRQEESMAPASSASHDH